MKIPNKRELHQIAFNPSADIDFRDFTNLYKNFTAKPYSVLVIDTTLASDNHLRFRENLVERIWKLIMIIDDKITNEKLKYDINREAEKISALWSGKVDIYDYLTGKEMLPSNQSQMKEQTMFVYFPLEKGFEKQT